MTRARSLPSRSPAWAWTESLAGIGVGAYRDDRDAYEHVRRTGAVYEPDLDRTTRYSQWLPIYKSLYPELKSVSHAISDLLRT